MDIFLKQRIQFSRITRRIFTTSLHTIRRVAPQHRDRSVTTDDCDVASPYVYSAFNQHNTIKLHICSLLRKYQKKKFK